MSKTYVVTGGAGFIGSHIAARLLRDGHGVRVIDNLITGSQATLNYLRSLDGDLSIYSTSITDYEALPALFEDVDVVFHQAALASVQLSVENPRLTHEHCVTGTLNVLEAARACGVRRVIYAASSAAYGNEGASIQHEGLLPQPISPYGVAKLSAEYYCQVFYQVYGLETVALRYFNVFGERQDPESEYAAVIPKFITAMLNGEIPIIYGDGEQSRDFTYVENIVYGNLLAAEAPAAAGQMMNLATGQRVSLLELVAQLNAILGTDVAPVHEPDRAGDIKHSRADIERAATLLDYAPIVDFEEGLRRTVAWYRDQVSTI